MTMRPSSAARTRRCPMRPRRATGFEHAIADRHHRHIAAQLHAKPAYLAAFHGFGAGRHIQRDRVRATLERRRASGWPALDDAAHQRAGIRGRLAVDATIRSPSLRPAASPCPPAMTLRTAGRGWASRSRRPPAGRRQRDPWHWRATSIHAGAPRGRSADSTRARPPPDITSISRQRASAQKRLPAADGQDAVPSSSPARPPAYPRPACQDRGAGSCVPARFRAAYSSTARIRLKIGPAATMAMRLPTGWALKEAISTDSRPVEDRPAS